MTARIHKARVFLDAGINTLSGDVGGASVAHQFFSTVRVIMTLVRDKMIANDSAVQLAEYCFNLCERLRTTIHDENTNVLDESVLIGIEDLGRVTREIELVLRRGTSIPPIEYDKDKIERYKLEIQGILDGLDARKQPLPRSAAIHESENALRRLIRREFVPDQFPSLIEKIFAREDADEMVRSLPKDRSQAFIDVVNEALGWPNLSQLVRRQCLRPLYRICSHHSIIPRAIEVPTCYDRTGFPLYKGGNADVWKGVYCGRDVAVKVIRTYTKSDLQKVVGRFCKEVVTWKTLQHPNVLPLVGVTMSEFEFAMVSCWMENGNINEFLKANPYANRFELLEGVANGLIYIHDQEMIHGDLKGANILIDQTCRARLADFGLLTIISDPANLLASSSCAQSGTGRWMSPELISPPEFGFLTFRPTKASDCYSLGMVIYEIISGNPPFHEDPGFTVFVKVVKGERPKRGEVFTESLWRMLERCWMSKPNDRPRVEDVLRYLETCSDSPVPHALVLGPEPSPPTRTRTPFPQQYEPLRPVENSWNRARASSSSRTDRGSSNLWENGQRRGKQPQASAICTPSPPSANASSVHTPFKDTKIASVEVTQEATVDDFPNGIGLDESATAHDCPPSMRSEPDDSMDIDEVPGLGSIRIVKEVDPPAVEPPITPVPTNAPSLATLSPDTPNSIRTSAGSLPSARELLLLLLANNTAQQHLVTKGPVAADFFGAERSKSHTYQPPFSNRHQQMYPLHAEQRQQGLLGITDMMHRCVIDLNSSEDEGAAGSSAPVLEVDDTTPDLNTSPSSVQEYATKYSQEVVDSGANLTEDVISERAISSRSCEGWTPYQSPIRSYLSTRWHLHLTGPIDAVDGSMTSADLRDTAVVGNLLKPLKMATLSKNLSPYKRICQFEVPGGGVCRDNNCKNLHIGELEMWEPSDNDTARYLSEAFAASDQYQRQRFQVGVKKALEATRTRHWGERGLVFEDRVSAALSMLGVL